MKRLVAIGCLVTCACSPIPGEWGFGEVESFYDRGDIATAEAIIRQNGEGDGYSDFRYFPWSMNILVHHGLDGDVNSFVLARKTAEKLKTKTVDYYYDAYLEMLPHLERHGLEATFASQDSADCPGILGRLEDMSDTALQHRYGRADFEAAYWYSLYANSRCNSPLAKAVLVEALAETNAPEASKMLARLADAGVDAGVAPELCKMRGKDMVYASSGLRGLEASGSFHC